MNFTISFLFGFSSFILAAFTFEMANCSSSTPAAVASSYLLAPEGLGSAGGSIHPGQGYHHIPTCQLGGYQLFLT